MLPGYHRRVVGVDVVVVVVVVLGGQFSRFDANYRAGIGPTDVAVEWLISVAVIAIWFALLGIEGAWDSAILGSGATEYRRVAVASLLLFAMVGIVAVLSGADIFRGYLLISAPLGIGGLLLGRWCWRRGLRRSRHLGQHLRTVLVLGDRVSTGPLCVALRDRPEAGYRVIGLCLPPRPAPLDAPFGATAFGATTVGASVGAVEDVPEFGDWADIAGAAIESGADVVAVAATDTLSCDLLPELTWRLQNAGIRLIADRNLLGIADSVAPDLIPGLPFISITGLRLHGSRLATKTAFDYLLAGIGIVLLSPFIVLAAVAVVLADGGPAFSVWEWAGVRGRHVRVWSFRCTTRKPRARLAVGGDASIGDAATADEATVAGHTAQRRYQLDTTKVGSVLCRTGIVHAPRLVAVLTGGASLVGSRPRLYAASGSRPTQVKPGLTGQWRLSGLSSQDEGAGPDGDQLLRDLGADFSYVNQWSAGGDLRIIAKTITAILAGRDRG